MMMEVVAVVVVWGCYRLLDIACSVREIAKVFQDSP